MSGLRKSNPYENLNRAMDPFDPLKKVDRKAMLEKQEKIMKEEGLEIEKGTALRKSGTTIAKPAERMKFNFKRHNSVQRKLNYDHILEGMEEVSFDRIDSNLRTDYLETKLREILVDQVGPIVTLSKKNLLYNA